MKTKNFFLAFTMCFVSLTSMATTDIVLNSGVYEIYTPKGLWAFANLVNGEQNTQTATTSGDGFATFGQVNPALDAKLMADIDLSTLCGVNIGGTDIDFPRIGINWDNSRYAGTFEGNNKTVSNLHITRPNMQYNGLFACLKGATIQNLTLDNANVVGQKQSATLVGNVENGSQLINCHVMNSKVSITVDLAGGMAGDVGGGSTLTSCSSTNVTVAKTGTVNGPNVGGLVGNLAKGSIAECFVTNSTIKSTKGSVGGITGQAGSLIGQDINPSAITESYCTSSTIIGDVLAGGIVGKAIGTTIADCYNTSAIETTSATGGQAGGIAGRIENNGTISTSHNEGTITTKLWDAGGIAGGAVKNILIEDCYNIGTITAGQRVGGITGISQTQSIVRRCYNTGTISTASYHAGGISGVLQDNSFMESCYNTGDVTAAEADAGGVVGHMKTNSTLVASYNTGDVTGKAKIGGVAGFFGEVTEDVSKIIACYNTGVLTCTGEATANNGVVDGKGGDCVLTACYSTHETNLDGTAVADIVALNAAVALLNNASATYNDAPIADNKKVTMSYQAGSDASTPPTLILGVPTITPTSIESSEASMNIRIVGNQLILDRNITAVALFNLTGVNLPASIQDNVVDIANFPQGIYILRAVTTDGKTLTAKFVK